MMKTAELDYDDTQDLEAETEVNEDTNFVLDDEGEAEDDGDEVVVSIGEDPPPQEEDRAPQWVRELRKSNREKERKIRDLEARLNAAPTETKPVVLGKKPSLEECDYDAEEYERKIAAWYEDKRLYDTEQAKAEAQRDAETKAWQGKLDSYAKAKASLKVRDYDEAEAFALDTFSVTQQGIVLQGSEQPAVVIYALGKNQKKAKELSSITDPVKFAFAIAKLETQLKVSNRKATTTPEGTIRSGGGRISGAIDQTLERLREEAARTGNMTKVMQYKAQKRNAASKT
jgi:hypothetical protein